MRMLLVILGLFKNGLSPNLGFYTIECWGAVGGASSVDPQPGKGIKIRNNFYLEKDDIIEILVGKRGTNNTTDQGGNGGGGGSFVVKSNGTPLIIAGGGGGAGDRNKNSADGIDATIENNGTDNSSTDPAGIASGGIGGGGGGGARGGGGGGFRWGDRWECAFRLILQRC